MNAVYKIVICTLRRFLKSDKFAAPIAGFLAGLCMYIEEKSRRTLFTVLFLGRVADISYSMGEARGLCKRFALGGVFVYIISNMSQ